MTTDNSVARVTQGLREALDRTAPGERLPSVRALMAKYGVGPSTVQRAMASLTGEGLIEARPGEGTFVRLRAVASVVADLSWQSVALGAARFEGDPMAGLMNAPDPGTLALSTGYLPPDLQATRLLAAAMRDVATKPALWDRLPVDGLDALRSWFAREGAAGFSAHEVLICPGGQSALASAFQALAPPGAPLLVEAPTYVGAIAAARAAGLVLVPVPTDASGVKPDLLEAAFRKTGARLFYCQPTYANPTGAVLSPERRTAVLEVLRAARAFVIEDDWARDLAFRFPPPTLAAEDRDGHVVLVRSLAKGVAPGLRVAAVMARGAALARLRAARASSDLFVSGALQAAALAVVTAPGWARHLQAVRVALAARRDVLVTAVRAGFGQDSITAVPNGGMHLWVRLPDHVFDLALEAALARDGVRVSAGRPWFPADPPGSFLRLTFAAPPDDLRLGVVRIAAAIGRMS